MAPWRPGKRAGVYLIEKASLREFQGALLLVRQLMDWDPSRTTNAPPHRVGRLLLASLLLVSQVYT
jgi:hypothetical protein